MSKQDSGWRSGRHVVYKLHVHLVFVTKCRRGAIPAEMHPRLETWFSDICEDFEAELLEYGGEDDHVHLLVAYPPKVAISALVNSLKGVSSRRVRSLRLPAVRKKIWGSAFWSPSYCAVSAGGASLETVRRYIENQREYEAES